MPSAPRISHASLRDGLKLQIVLMIFIAGLPIVAFGGYVVLRFYEGQQRVVREELFRQANALSAAMDQIAAQQIRVLETLAGSDELDKPDLARFHQDAQRAEAQNPEWASLVLIDPVTGAQLLNTRRPFSTHLPLILDFESVRQVATTGRPAIVAQSGQRGILTGVPIIGFRVPVIRNGEVRYVLGMLLNSSALQNALAEQNVPETWTASVLDLEGTIIARNRRSEEFVGQLAGDELRSAIARGIDGIFEATNREDTPTYTVLRRSPITNWIIALGAPKAEIDPLRQRAMLGVMASGLASLLLAAILAFLLGRMIVHNREARERHSRLRDTERALSEKDVLLREVHHRVKNNLQMMASMVRIIARDASPDSQSTLHDVTQRIEALGAAYSQIHDATDLHRLDLAAYVKQVASKTTEAFGTPRIQLNSDLDVIYVDIDTALPVGLIANELLTNAFKHAFPDGRSGEILVRLERRNVDIGILTVSDTGIGLPASDCTDSFGLKIAKNMARQVNGRLYAVTRPKGGAQFRLIFMLMRHRVAA